MTFSIVARCARTGQFGMAISSSSPAVAARCAHVRAGVGAVASQNIKQLVEECGGKMEHVCKVVVYLTDVRHREAVYRTMGEYIKGVHPVSTGVVVTALARPSWLVEIDGTAVIPDDEA